MIYDINGNEITTGLGFIHTNPESSGVLNLIKRARQLTDIKWTPSFDIPRLSVTTAKEYGVSSYFEDVFKEGVEYTGIPYSRADNSASDYGYSNMFPAFKVPLSAFVTSVRNQNSAEGKESVYSVGNNRASFFGHVCSSFVCYVLGLSTYYSTSNMTNIQGLNYVAHLIDNNTRIDLSLLKLGDVLLYPTHHTAIITDIVTDSNGDVQYIELSEATTYGNSNKDYKGGQNGGLCRRLGWSVDDFFEFWKDYDLYRYQYVDNITYTKSRYVNVGDELDEQINANLPCIPYMGDGFAYKVGYIYNSDILIACQGYNTLKVFKDGSLFDSYSVTNETEKITVPFTDVGEYKAYLCNVSNGAETTRTMECEWSVTNQSRL